MTTFMYILYVGFDYTYIDINTLAQGGGGGLNPFWPHKFGFKPLLGLEPMAPIRPQLQLATLTIRPPRHVCMYR